MFTKEFQGTGSFQAIWAAEKWLKERGYSHGSMDSDNPMGVKFGDCLIRKWTNMRVSERRQMDGTIESKDFRSGPVVVKLKNIFEEPAPCSNT